MIKLKGFNLFFVVCFDYHVASIWWVTWCLPNCLERGIFAELTILSSLYQPKTDTEQYCQRETTYRRKNMVNSRGFANSVQVCGKETTFWQHLIELGGNYWKRERDVEFVTRKQTITIIPLLVPLPLQNLWVEFFLHVGIKVGNHWGRENVMDRLCWRTLARLIFIKLIID